MITLLQAAASGSANAANAAAGTSGGGWSMWVMLLLIFAVMYFFMIRPQRKQQKQLEEMRRSLKKGDKVVSAGGIYGVVADVDDTTVTIKVDGDVKLKVDKNYINKLPDPNAAPAKKAETKAEEPKK